MCGIAAMDPHPISQWQTCCDGLKDTSSSTSVGIDVLDFKKSTIGANPFSHRHGILHLLCVRVCACMCAVMLPALFQLKKTTPI